MPSSSELSESGRFAGQRAPEKSTNFTQTCSLLSQYLKEKGTFGDLSLGMTRGPDANGIPETSPQTAATTMNLFPVANKLGDVSGASARNTALMMSRNFTSMELFPQNSGLVKEEISNKVDSSGNKSEPRTAQMTIFYGGQVIVFNDFPADKAKEIMLLASNGSSHNLSTYASTPVQKPMEPTNMVPTNPSILSDIGTNMVPERIQRPPQPIVADLPKIARKASLTRFLEKRKDRITARAPYVTSNSTAFPPKPAENMTWLGLAAQSPVQFEGQMY
ncbi:hypothetical protein RHMOL_Rhmol03G0250300 [Rhododendron molle]|uniref:Uncharacterized protein n=1 Tax=Rhododendron molle TaxID=49168 RepID=A0ACC0PI29_RHOML|nr:hypothetical protein RHMOL_Rhmol03G0250300 [Rhododendron molle]